MQEIILCHGLPASGKSTWSKQYCKDHSNYIRVNKDDIRELLGSPVFDREFENSVLDIQRKMGNTILDTGKSLIVDDTNFAKKHQEYWSQIAASRAIAFSIRHFDTKVEECIERDSKREKPVGNAVILDMYEKYIKPNK